MKALLINGSPRKNGNTHVALSEIARQLEKYGIESEIVWIGTKAVQGCIACYQCGSLGHCAFKDELYLTVREKLKESDALIVGSPTYYGGPNGSLCALLDRLFLSCKADIVNKVWASVAVCRRGGASTTFQRLNLYADMSNMVHATSQYWNIAYGRAPEDTKQDSEGLQTMRTLADNVAWLLKCTQSRKDEIPEREAWAPLNYIR